jgi:cell shape-determining protein MreC
MILLCWVFVSSAQKDTYPKIVMYQSDTVLAFTLKQARQLSVFNEERKECLDIRKDLENQLKEFDRINDEQKGQLVNLEKVKKDYDEVVKAINENNSLCEDEKKILKNQRNDQIKYKWFSIGAGTLTTLFMTYLYITK